MTWEPKIQKYSHEAMADALLVNPTISHAELAAMFGRSTWWVAQVKSSGMFRNILAQRRDNIVDPVLTSNLEERFEMLAHRSLDVLQEKLSQPAAAVADNLVIAAATLGAKVGGLGGFAAAKAPPAPPPVDLDRIERLATRLTNLNRPQGSTEIVDAVVHEVPQAG